MKNTQWVAGLLAAVTLIQASAHAEIISDLPGFEDGGSQGQTFRPPPPPMPNEGVTRQYTDVADLDQISRKSGGEAYRFNLVQPTNLKYLELTVQSSRLKIHEATVMTVGGQRYMIREFHNSNVLETGTQLTSENLNINDDIRTIELRMESYSHAATISLKAVGDRAVPRMSVQRPVIVAPPSQPNRPTQPTQPSRPVDTRLRSGDVVVSVSSQGKYYDGRVVEVYGNGKVLVRDEDDGKTYVRDISSVGKRISCASNGLCEGEEVMAYPVGSQAKAYVGKIIAIYSNNMVKMRDADDSKDYFRDIKVIHRRLSCLESLCVKDRVLSRSGDGTKYYSGVIDVIYSNGVILVRDDDDGKVYSRTKEIVFKSVQCHSSGLCIKDRVMSKSGDKYYFGSVTGVYSNGLIYVRDDDDGKSYARQHNVVFKEMKCANGFCRGDRVLSTLSNGRYYAGRVEGAYAGGLISVRDDDDGKVYLRPHTVLSRAR
ncbi:beta-sandwich domain-containing protein [Bdellovibrio bacteriovorus]|uniref:beta-sandwich domain-containing protein n=1 Tax=Bdellovibrio bacteriovorus TaxID=959 RepID=UPI003AA9BE9A